MAANVIEVLSRPEAEPNDSIVVGLSFAPTTLIVLDVASGKVRWKQPVEARTAPILLRDSVLVQTDKGRIVVFDLQDGRKALDVDVSGTLVGASGSRDSLAVALTKKPGSSPRGLVIGFGKGKQLWVRDLPYEVGVLVVSGGLVVVPWANQRVSILDVATGEERLRIVTPTMVTQAFFDNDRLYLGGNDLYRIAPGIESDPKDKGLALTPSRRPLPGAPPLVRSGIAPAPSPSDASFRVKLAWRTTPGDKPLGFENDLLYFVFYRFVFAYSASEDRLLWAYSHPQDIAGIAPSSYGLSLVDQRGGATALNAKDGRILFGPIETGEKLQMALIRSNTAPTGKGQPAGAGSLEETLTRMAFDPDSRLADGRALAVRGLGALDTEKVTQSLIELCRDKSQPAPVKNQACEELGRGRNKGAKFVREALATRAAYTEGKSAPPVGALSTFAAAQKMQTAMPDLLAHLGSPATPPQELGGVLKALGALGNASATEPVTAFLRLYHAEPASSPLVPALGQAAETLVTLEKAKARPLLEPVLLDPFTSEPLRESIKAALSTLEKPAASAPEAKDTTPPAKVTKETAAAAAPPPAPATDDRPERLSDKHVAKALAPVLTQLKKCLGKSLASVKIVMVIDASGSLVTRATTPPEADACLAPVLEKVKFPQTKIQDAQRVVYMLRR
jgi:hypothetical protein